MSEDHKNKEESALLKAPEVEEIIGKVPHWLVRTGISLVGAALSILLILSWFIQYPDLLQGGVVITTDPAPVVLVARVSGPIQPLMENQNFCKKGELIAVVGSAENWEQVLKLENLLMWDTSGGEWNFSDLGSLQDVYNEYEVAKRRRNQFIEAKRYQRQLFQIKKQLETQNKLKHSLVRQFGITRRQSSLWRYKYVTDSILFKQGVTSKADYKQSENEYLQNQKQLENTKAAIFDQEVRVEELKASMTRMELDNESDSSRLAEDYLSGKTELSMKIKQWKDRQLVIAPEAGRLTYLDMLIRNKYVRADEPLFSIVPDHGTILAIARIPAEGSGKVRLGQRVNIKLDNYPHEQFGMVVGSVKSISLVPTDEHYNLQIALGPGKLITTHRKELEIQVSLTGHTDIITDDMRLLERFFQWIRILKSRARDTQSRPTEKIPQ